MKSRIVIAALALGLSGTAKAQTHASAYALAVCGTGSSSTDAVHAAAVDNTRLDIPDCDPKGTATVSSEAFGPGGWLSGTGQGSGTVWGNWQHRLTSPVHFFSGATDTNVTLHLHGLAEAVGVIDGVQVNATETLFLSMTGDLGSFQTGPTALSSVQYLVAQGLPTIYDADYSFSFHGPSADILLDFSGQGSFDSLYSGYGTGAGQVSISTSSGGFTAPQSFFGSVPEPATWGLMLSGFTLVGAAVRFRRSASYG